MDEHHRIVSEEQATREAREDKWGYSFWGFLFLALVMAALYGSWHDWYLGMLALGSFAAGFFCLGRFFSN